MNRDLEEYNSWEESQNSVWTNIRKSMTPIHLIGLVVLLMFSFYMLNQSGINKNLVFVAIGVVIFFIIWRGTGKKEKIPIPENVIKIISLRLMKRKVLNEYPYGTQIYSLPYCGLRYQGEWGGEFKPWKWEVGIKIITPPGLKKDLLVCLHPYDGYITKIMDMPSGYDGKASSDLKVLMPTSFTVQKEDTGSQGQNTAAKT